MCRTTVIPNSTWLAGVDVFSFPGPTLGEQIAQAAHSIGAHVLSTDAIAPTSNVSNPNLPGFVEFTTPKMVQEAHQLGMEVKPWTVDDLDLVRRLVLEYGVDAIISDGAYLHFTDTLGADIDCWHPEPHDVRRWAKYEAGIPVSRPYPKNRVLGCLSKHNQLDSTSYLEDL